jgi:LacI family transcriptional regulator
MAKTRKIMVVHPVGDPQQMPTLRGILDYAREQHTWVLQLNPGMADLGLRHLVGWPGDGVITNLRTTTEVAAARALKLPVVNLAGSIRHTGVPRVMVDQEAMGRLAAEHLMSCGLSRFAYFGERAMWYSHQRRQGFARCLGENGYGCSVLDSTTGVGQPGPWDQWMRPIERWLKTLRPPVGLLAVHDYAGTILIDACLRLGLRVPEDVAVVGVDNDVITCEFCEVPLSSVARSNREVGYEAASLLDRLMDGAPPPEDILIPPEGVVRRRSTDAVATDDPQVAAAVRYIQEHLAERSCMDSLVRTLSISHRSLEIRFQKSLRCTPREYISRRRVERAEQLLAGNQKSKLQSIAKACGFTGPRHLREVFRRVTGLTPAEYRRRAENPSFQTLAVDRNHGMLRKR